MLKQIAFAHWNSIAATDFDFAPNESLDFTNEGNDQMELRIVLWQCTMI